MSLAIFILPEESFANEIVHWKERIENSYPNQPYTAHPPHMTLINMDVINKGDAIAIFSSLSNSSHPFQISIKQTSVFWDDAATGGHTLYFDVEKNMPLQDLQKIVANALKSVKTHTPPPNYLVGHKLLQDSYENFGFPFIGDHWIPHFSVSSLQSERTHPIIKDFLSINKQSLFMVNQMSLWYIDGNDHTQLKTVFFQ